MSIPTAGRIRARHAGHEVVADPSTGVVFGPGRPVYDRCTTRNSAELDVKIERGALEAELAALLGRPIDGPDRPAAGPSTCRPVPGTAGAGSSGCCATSSSQRTA